MRKIYQAISQIFGEIMTMQPEELSPAASLAALRYQELAAAVIACEKTFQINMEDERIKELNNIEDWVSYVKERIAQSKENMGPATEKERETWYYS